MKFLTISKALLFVLLCMGLSTSVTAEDKGKNKPAKVSKKMHEYLMSRVANKHVLTKKGGSKQGSFNIATAPTASAVQRPDDGGEQKQSTEPMDKNILERSKATPNVTAETTDLLGEQIDLNSGSISFKQADVSLPGNSGLEVAIRRTFRGKGGWGAGMADFSDWNLDIPHIHTTLGYFYASDSNNYSGSWGDNQGCSGPLNPGYTFDAYKIYQDYQYWNGDTLNVPGHVNDKLLEASLWAGGTEASQGGQSKKVQGQASCPQNLFCTDPSRWRLVELHGGITSLGLSRLMPTPAGERADCKNGKCLERLRSQFCQLLCPPC